MPDWTSSMQQTFEYYIVDPGTWRDKTRLDTVRSCSIERDLEADTLGSASFDIVNSVGECYIRVYLITIQNGIREKHPLGTFLVQTPSSNFDGKVRTVTMDAYTPLLELKENQPPLGYYIPKGRNVLEEAYNIVSDHVRAPVIKPVGDTLNTADFTAYSDDTWLSFVSEFISYHIYNAEDISGPSITKYECALDEMGRILFAPKQEIASMQPVWTYDDDNSSILYPEFSMQHDLFNIPNVVEVIYAIDGTNYHLFSYNYDPDSPTSIPSRGREIIYRVTNPDIAGNPNKDQVQEYADQLLRSLSTVEYTISYTHGYCPVRIGDCVRLNYRRAGMNDVKAKVISQSISCRPGCQVTERAVYTTKLYGRVSHEAQ